MHAYIRLNENVLNCIEIYRSLARLKKFKITLFRRHKLEARRQFRLYWACVDNGYSNYGIR